MMARSDNCKTFAVFCKRVSFLTVILCCILIVRDLQSAEEHQRSRLTVEVNSHVGEMLPAYAHYQSIGSTRKHSNLMESNFSDGAFSSSFLYDENPSPFSSKNLSSTAKCRSPSNVVPILRRKQVNKNTIITNTHFSVFGDGLRQATVGKPAQITIKIHKSIQKGLYSEYFFSVLAVGDKHIFHATPSELNLTSLEVNFTYSPTLPGQYDLYVEMISRKLQNQLPGSPYKLVVDGPAISDENRRKMADRLPSCQTLPQTDLAWSEGNWVTRDLAGEKRGTLRSGWVLQPNRCSIDIFTRRDLEMAAASPTLKTIFVLGRSTERGVFLSLVDILLTKEEKVHIKSSVVWKCWGFMEVRLGNLRFIYQDFRAESASMEKVKDKHYVNITCHNEKKVSSNNDFFGDAIGFFQETLFKDYFRPDIILLIVKYSHQLKLLSKVIPSFWRGHLYAMNGFKSQEGSVYTFRGRQADLREAREFVTFDKRFLALDGFTLATPWRHDTEKSPLPMASPHWHRFCNERNGDMHVCGNPTEMVAQILLGKALAPNGKDIWLSLLEKCDSQNKTSTREITICHDCPKSLTPWHIKRTPNLVCSTSSQLEARNNTDIQAWDGSLCPSECMKIAPIAQEEIQSGRVDVRVCTVLKID